MVYPINIVNSVFESFSSTSKGGTLFIKRPTNVLFLNLQFIKSQSTDYGGSCYIECTSFLIKCCSFTESCAVSAVALFLKAEEYSKCLLSSISYSKIQQTAKDSNGAPTLIHYTAFDFNNLNYSYNTVNHICGSTSYNCYTSYYKYISFCNSQSLKLSVVAQTEENQELVSYIHTNFVDNNMNNGNLGLVRSYKCDTKLTMCYFRDNIANLLFQTTEGNIDLIYCSVDEDISSISFNTIELTDIDMNIIDSQNHCEYCSLCNKDFFYSNNFLLNICIYSLIFLLN